MVYVVYDYVIISNMEQHWINGNGKTVTHHVKSNCKKNPPNGTPYVIINGTTQTSPLTSVRRAVFSLTDDAGTNYEMRPNGGGGGGDDVSDDGATAWLLSGSDAADKVRFILAGEGGESISIAQHSIFCQMDLLCHFDSGEMGWKEMTRLVTCLLGTAF
jgi:hypothetical protein